MMNVLVTGGAGFIGSNLVEALLSDPEIGTVRVLDDLSNGYYHNVEEFLSNPRYEFIEGDICDYETCLKATEGMNRISHQAALGSVPRSIKNPMRSTQVNITGTVNLMHAAIENGLDRILLACSSSTYGDSKTLPKVEDVIGKPLSPYAVTKACIESFADVFKKTYNLDYIGFRYFNIFGPRQSPDNPYAAVIPLFCKAFLKNESPVIFGDGLTSRDFTFVSNAVQANILGLKSTRPEALNQIYNIACGEQTSLLDMVNRLNQINNTEIQPVFAPERAGDVKHSKADISKAIKLLDYKPDVLFNEGLGKVFDWYKKTN